MPTDPEIRTIVVPFLTSINNKILQLPPIRSLDKIRADAKLVTNPQSKTHKALNQFCDMLLTTAKTKIAPSCLRREDNPLYFHLPHLTFLLLVYRNACIEADANYTRGVTGSPLQLVTDELLTRFLHPDAFKGGKRPQNIDFLDAIEQGKFNQFGTKDYPGPANRTLGDLAKDLGLGDGFIQGIESGFAIASKRDEEKTKVAYQAKDVVASAGLDTMPTEVRHRGIPAAAPPVRENANAGRAPRTAAVHRARGARHFDLLRRIPWQVVGPVLGIALTYLIYDSYAQSKLIEVSNPESKPTDPLNKLGAAKGPKPDLTIELTLTKSALAKMSHQERSMRLFSASQNGQLDMVDKLLTTNMDPNTAHPYIGENPLYLAAKAGHIKVVKRLLKEKNIEVDKALKDGTTPLMVASYEGNLEIVDILLKAGANPKKTGPKGVTSLYWAADKNHPEIVARLLKEETVLADVDKAVENGVTPLMASCATGSAYTVDMLLAAGANPNMSDLLGNTPLCWAIEKNHPAVVERLLKEENIEIDKANGNGFTPLMLAAEVGTPEAFSMLLAAGADLSKTMDGRSIRDIAEAWKNTEIVDLIDKHLEQQKVTPGSAPAKAAAQPAKNRTRVI